MTNSITVSLPTPNSSNLTQSSSRPVLSRLHLKTEKARRTLHEFVVQAWPLLEPATPFVEGMHVRAVCEHLQAVAQGRLRHLIINIPPGHAKSLLTAVFWPAWVWIDHPEARWLFGSYREPLATRDSVKCRRLIESDWYQERWGDRYQLSGDQNQKNRFENTRTGYRVVVPMSAGTGERGDYVVVDDPAGPASSSWVQQASRRKTALGRPRAGRRGTLTQNVPLGSRVVSQKVNFLGQGNKGRLISSAVRRRTGEYPPARLLL